MSTQTLSYAPPARPASTLAQKTMSGFFWLLAQTMGAKLVTMVGQVVLARLLSPAAFGLVGLAYTVTAFAGLVQQAGLREILIHRQQNFTRWSNPAFWLSFTLGCVGAIVMLMLAPVAAHMYDDPRLIKLILVLALAAPFSPLDIVPDAKLTSEMKFRYLAMVKWITAVGTMGLSILFAWKGMGAYSFVVPVPIITAVRLVLLWSAARPAIRWDMAMRRWKYFVNDTFLLFLANFFIMLTWQGDYMILGVMHDAKTVGLYFFAFNLSIQTMSVFTSNLAGVLFPALSKLQGDVLHQTRAFLRAAELLAIVGVPLCLLQAALAGPLMSMLFNSFWIPAIRILQLLSIGMAVRLVASPGGSLLQAQGRFKTYFIINGINAAVFLTMVFAGSEAGKWVVTRWGWNADLVPAAILVAAAVASYFAFIGPIFMYVAIKPGNGKWGDVWRVYWAPAVASIIAVGIGVLCGRQVPHFKNDPTRHMLRVMVITMMTTALYIPLIRYLAPHAFAELLNRVMGLIRSRTHRLPAATGTPAVN